MDTRKEKNEGTVIKPREPAIDLIRVISEGTYTTFAQGLKEFVSNAYDADASRVDIEIDEDCETVVIRDNGVGISLTEFTNTFSSIARTGKSGEGDIPGVTKKGRKKIGRFGVGALAIVGVADKFLVRSTKSGSNHGFEGGIDLREVRKNFYKDEDLSKHWLFSRKTWLREPEDYSYTEIIIEGLKEDISTTLQRPGEKNLDEFFYKVTELSGVDELRWRLGIICPVGYENGYPINEGYLRKPIDKFVLGLGKRYKKDVFKLFLNGIEITRLISLPSYNPKRLKQEKKAGYLLKRGLGFELRNIFAKKGSPFDYKGYIVTQAMQIFPEELRGLLVRIRGVGIGWHRTLYIPSQAPSTIRQAMSGEVWVDGLDEALQFDRESFREDHPLFVKFRDELTELHTEEGREARRRSEKRKSIERGKRPPKELDTKVPPRKERKREYEGEAYQLIPNEIVEGQPKFITNIVAQVNGCWNHEYYEACALMIRRLIETFIIELYVSRNGEHEIKTKSNEYFGLKKLIDKISEDLRFRFEPKFIKPLKSFKELGDYAAHGYKVLVRKPYILEKRDELRFIIDRFVFEIARSRGKL